MIRLRLAAIAAAFAMSACGLAATAKVKRNPALKPGAFAGRTLHVLPIMNLYIENKSDFRDDLGGRAGDAANQRAVIGRMFYAELARRARKVKVVHDSALTEPPGEPWLDTLIDFKHQGYSTELHFRLPTARQAEAAGLASDYIMVFNGLGFSRQENPFRNTGNHTTGESLNLVGSFLVWDYKTASAAAYGRFFSPSNLVFAMTEGDWNTAVAKAVSNIAQQSGMLQ